MDHPAVDSAPRRDSSEDAGGTTTRWRSSCRSNGWRSPSRRHNIVLVPISGVHRAVVQAIEYAKTLSSDVRAVYVNLDATAAEQVAAGSWRIWGRGVPLIVLDSPYRSLMEPLLEYIEQVGARSNRRVRHRGASGVCAGPLVAASLPQPAGASDQGRTIVQAERRSHERTVSPVPLVFGVGSRGSP